MPNRCLTTAELVDAAAGALSPARSEHLATCPLCAAAVEALELTDDADTSGLRTVAAIEEAVQRLPTALAAASVTTTARIVPLVRRIAAAAAVLVLALAGYRYAKQPAAVPVDELQLDVFAYVEQPYERVVRSGQNTSDYYAEAARAYAQADFPESVVAYRQLLDEASSESLRLRGHYELGLALWRAGNYVAASEHLTTARLGDATYYEDATWALAQLYRATGQTPLARQLYLDLTRLTRGPYQARAEAMLAALATDDESR